MHPRMLEIGEDTNQTSALINIHDDLMRRLKVHIFLLNFSY